MARPIHQAPIHPAMVEVAVRAGHDILMEVDDNNALIVGTTQGIFGPAAQSRPNSPI